MAQHDRHRVVECNDSGRLDIDNLHVRQCVITAEAVRPAQGSCIVRVATVYSRALFKFRDGNNRSYITKGYGKGSNRLFAVSAFEAKKHHQFPMPCKQSRRYSIKNNVWLLFIVTFELNCRPVCKYIASDALNACSFSAIDNRIQQ